MQKNGVHELRLVVTAENYDQALHFCRDVLIRDPRGKTDHCILISPSLWYTRV
jgi:hypothetical protein